MKKEKKKELGVRICKLERLETYRTHGMYVKCNSHDDEKKP